jgi:hypothetical protein
MEENLRLFKVGVYSECVITCAEVSWRAASTQGRTRVSARPPALKETTPEAETEQRQELGQRITQQELVT